jgi:hypothetical protein
MLCNYSNLYFQLLFCLVSVGALFGETRNRDRIVDIIMDPVDQNRICVLISHDVIKFQMIGVHPERSVIAHQSYVVILEEESVKGNGLWHPRGIRKISEEIDGSTPRNLIVKEERILGNKYVLRIINDNQSDKNERIEIGIPGGSPESSGENLKKLSEKFTIASTIPFISNNTMSKFLLDISGQIRILDIISGAIREKKSVLIEGIFMNPASKFYTTDRHYLTEECNYILLDSYFPKHNPHLFSADKFKNSGIFNADRRAYGNVTTGELVLVPVLSDGGVFLSMEEESRHPEFLYAKKISDSVQRIDMIDESGMPVRGVDIDYACGSITCASWFTELKKIILYNCQVLFLNASSDPIRSVVIWDYRVNAVKMAKLDWAQCLSVLYREIGESVPLEDPTDANQRKKIFEREGVKIP